MTVEQYAKDISRLSDVGGGADARGAQGASAFQVLIFLIVFRGAGSTSPRRRVWARRSSCIREQSSNPPRA